MAVPRFRLAKQVGRVASMIIPLTPDQEAHFERLMDVITLVDMHHHPMVLTEDLTELHAYFREHAYQRAYEGVRHGGWAAVGTANGLSCSANASDGSFGHFEDLVDEIALMQAHLSKQGEDVVRITCAKDILNARQRGDE